jgi:hypothetical protein
MDVPVYNYFPLPDGGVMATISALNYGIIARGGGNNRDEV